MRSLAGVYNNRTIWKAQLKATVRRDIQHRTGRAEVISNEKEQHTIFFSLTLIYYSYFHTVCPPCTHTVAHTRTSIRLLILQPTIYIAYSRIFFSNQIFPVAALQFVCFFGLSGMGAMKWDSIRHRPTCLHYITGPSGCPRLSFENTGQHVGLGRTESVFISGTRTGWDT